MPSLPVSIFCGIAVSACVCYHQIEWKLIIQIHKYTRTIPDLDLSRQVPAVDSLRASGIGAIVCMLKNCRPQITACLADEECKAGLDCLQACSPTDQARSFDL